jgi:hypothetical protein
MKSIWEQGRQCNPSDCKSWGLSVWLEKEDALHARALVPFFRKCYIVRVDFGLTDGVLLPTPSDDQPGHHTYWKRHGLQLPSERFASIIEPEST